MTKTKIFLLMAIALLIPAVIAQDINMTEEELAAYVQEQVAAAIQEQQAKQPQIVTVQLDQELSEKLDLIMAKLTEIDTGQDQMQNRFNTMSDNVENVVVNQSLGVIQQVTQDVQAQFNDDRKIMKEYVNYATNPVRTNLPIIGVLLIFAGAFLLWASHKYRLTEGSRQSYELTEPKKLIEDKKPEEKKKPKNGKKLPVKVTKTEGTPLTEEEQIMLSSLPVSKKIQLLKQLEGEEKDG